MKVRTVRERDKLLVGDPTVGLTELQAAILDRLTPILPAGAFTWEHKAIRMGSFCGVLRVEDLMIEILPKVGLADNDDRGILIAMLRCAGELAAIAIGSGELKLQALHLLDVFILDFCNRVNEMFEAH